MGKAKPKAILTITLRNNDVVHAVLQKPKEDAVRAKKVRDWREIYRLLDEVMPMEERRRQAAARSTGDNDLKLLKVAIMASFPASGTTERQAHSPPLDQAETCANQDLGKPQKQMSAPPSLPQPLRIVFGARERQPMASGETVVIRIGAQEARGLPALLKDCLSAIQHLARSVSRLLTYPVRKRSA